MLFIINQQRDQHDRVRRRGPPLQGRPHLHHRVRVLRHPRVHPVLHEHGQGAGGRAQVGVHQGLQVERQAEVEAEHELRRGRTGATRRGAGRGLPRRIGGAGHRAVDHMSLRHGILLAAGHCHVRRVGAVGVPRLCLLLRHQVCDCSLYILLD